MTTYCWGPFYCRFQTYSWLLPLLREIVFIPRYCPSSESSSLLPFSLRNEMNENPGNNSYKGSHMEQKHFTFSSKGQQRNAFIKKSSKIWGHNRINSGHLDCVLSVSVGTISGGLVKLFDWRKLRWPWKDTKSVRKACAEKKYSNYETALNHLNRETLKQRR